VETIEEANVVDKVIFTRNPLAVGAELDLGNNNNNDDDEEEEDEGLVTLRCYVNCGSDDVAPLSVTDVLVPEALLPLCRAVLKLEGGTTITPAALTKLAKPYAWRGCVAELVNAGVLLMVRLG